MKLYFSPKGLGSLVFSSGKKSIVAGADIEPFIGVIEPGIVKPSSSDVNETEFSFDDWDPVSWGRFGISVTAGGFIRICFGTPQLTSCDFR